MSWVRGGVALWERFGYSDVFVYGWATTLYDGPQHCMFLFPGCPLLPSFFTRIFSEMCLVGHAHTCMYIHTHTCMYV